MKIEKSGLAVHSSIWNEIPLIISIWFSCWRDETEKENTLADFEQGINAICISGMSENNSA